MFVVGWRRFCKDIELMIGREPAMFWKVTWMTTCPIGITVRTFMNIVTGSVVKGTAYAEIYRNTKGGK